MPFRRRTLVPILLFLACATGGAARAADKPRPEGVLGGGKPGAGAYLTREQLRDCMARQERLKADDAGLVQEQAAVQADKEALSREDDDMKTQLAAVDRTKAESVDAYNAAVEARNRRIEAFQARASAFNTRVEASEQTHAAYGSACSNRRYFEEDAAALKKSAPASNKP